MAVLSNTLMSRLYLLLVVLATVAGGALRFVAIGQQSFWYDEAFVDAMAARSSIVDTATGRARENGSPPLYSVLDKLVAQYVGTDEVSHRTLPAIFGTLAIPLIALLGRRLSSADVGAVAAWLLATSPLQVELANESRVYSFLHFITALNSFLFLRWLSSRSWPDGIVYAGGTVVACYSHYYIVFVILAHLVTVVCQPDRWRLLARWCVLMGVVAVLWMPWVPAFIAQLTTPGNLTRMSDSWKTQFAATPVVFAVGRTFAWRDSGPVLLLGAVVVSLVGWCGPAVLGLSRRDTASPVTRPLLSAWVLLPVLVPLAVAVTGNPLYHHRYGSVGLPAFLISVAIGLTRLPPIWRAAVAVVIIAGTTYSLANYYSHPIKDDWRSATGAILDDAPPRQVVLTDSDIEIVPFLYYAREHNAVPHEAYGLIPESDGSNLIAVRYEDGVKRDTIPRNYTSDILSAQCVTIGLCVSHRDENAYRAFFGSNGYQVTNVANYYRVTVLRFERPER